MLEIARDVVVRLGVGVDEGDAARRIAGDRAAAALQPRSRVASMSKPGAGRVKALPKSPDAVASTCTRESLLRRTVLDPATSSRTSRPSTGTTPDPWKVRCPTTCS